MSIQNASTQNTSNFSWKSLFLRGDKGTRGARGTESSKETSSSSKETGSTRTTEGGGILNTALPKDVFVRNEGSAPNNLFARQFGTQAASAVDFRNFRANGPAQYNMRLAALN